MDQQKEKEQKPMIGKDEEEEDNSHSIANKMALAQLEEMAKHLHRRLPLELECEIFKCLKEEIQYKFIWGMGRGIYGIFRHQLLVKTKKVRNPHGNRLNGAKTRATVAADGLNVISSNFGDVVKVYAVQPFPTSGPQCRMDEFPVTILYYFKIKHLELEAQIRPMTEEKLKEENKAIRARMEAAEEKAQMAKNELEKITLQRENPQELEALLGNVIAILKEEQKETTSSNLEPEIPQNSLDCHRRVPLPLELNFQIFECLKFGIQRKFIGGLGQGIYGIFRQKVLKKDKRLQNPGQNVWNNSNTDAIISSNGLFACENTRNWVNIFAKKGFPITGEFCRTDNFPETIVYYFEVTIMSRGRRVIFAGFSSGNIPNGSVIGELPNSYGVPIGYDYCFLSGEDHDFE